VKVRSPFLSRTTAIDHPLLPAPLFFSPACGDVQEIAVKKSARLSFSFFLFSQTRREKWPPNFSFLSFFWIRIGAGSVPSPFLWLNGSFFSVSSPKLFTLFPRHPDNFRWQKEALRGVPFFLFLLVGLARTVKLHPLPPFSPLFLRAFMERTQKGRNLFFFFLLGRWARLSEAKSDEEFPPFPLPPGEGRRQGYEKKYFPLPPFYLDWHREVAVIEWTGLFQPPTSFLGSTYERRWRSVETDGPLSFPPIGRDLMKLLSIIHLSLFPVRENDFPQRPVCL